MMGDRWIRVAIVVLCVVIVVHGWCITQVGIRVAVIERKEVGRE